MHTLHKPASSGPRADHPQFPSAISISSFHPQFLCNVTSSFKSIKKSKSKPVSHRNLSYIQKTIFFQFVLYTEENFVLEVSFFDYRNDLNQHTFRKSNMNIKINISFPKIDLRTAVSKPSYTLIKIKRIIFFHKQKKSYKKEKCLNQNITLKTGTL